MPLPYAPGHPCLQVLDAVGNATLSVYLPPPDKGGSLLRWAKKVSRHELPDGSERERVKGWIPVLTLRWRLYPDLAGTGYVRGGGNGQVATLQDLLLLLATPPGRLRVIPGPSQPAVGFRALVTKDPEPSLEGAGLGGNITIELTGMDSLPAPVLPTVPTPPAPLRGASASAFPVPHW